MDYNDLLNSLLTRIMGSITFEETSYKIQYPNGFDHDRLMTVFVNELMTEYCIGNKLDSLRYYFPQERGVYYPSEIIEILRELKQNNNCTMNDFMLLLDNKLKNIEQLPIENYDIFCPVNINTSETVNTLKIKDAQVTFLRYTDIVDKINTVINDARFLGEKFTATKYMYIYVSVRARNKFYAIERAREFVLLTLSIIGYFQNRQRVTYFISGEPKPLFDIRPNYLFAFNNSSLLSIVAYDERSDQGEMHKLDDQCIESLNSLIGTLNALTKKARDLLVRALQSYYYGIIEKRLDYSFLSFWTALEIALLKDKSTPQFRIIKRLKSLLPKIGPLENSMIDRLYNLRNNAVHKGDDKYINQHERNILKLYVEFAIYMFITLIKDYSLKDLDFIYRHYSESVVDLENKKKLIDDTVKIKRDLSHI